MLPILAVVFDFGAITPMELILESEELCELLFVCDPMSPYVARSMPLLEGAGTVIERDHPDLTAESLRRAGVSGIVTFGDTELSYTSELAARLGLPFHGPETVAVLSDKYMQRGRLSEQGVDAVRFAAITAGEAVTDAAEHVGMPAVLKPRQGAASRNTSLVRTVEELTESVKQSFAAGETSMILEEYLVGDRSVAGESWVTSSRSKRSLSTAASRISESPESCRWPSRSAKPEHSFRTPSRLRSRSRYAR